MPAGTGIMPRRGPRAPSDARPARGCTGRAARASAGFAMTTSPSERLERDPARRLKLCAPHPPAQLFRRTRPAFAAACTGIVPATVPGASRARSCASGNCQLEIVGIERRRRIIGAVSVPSSRDGRVRPVLPAPAWAPGSLASPPAAAPRPRVGERPAQWRLPTVCAAPVSCTTGSATVRTPAGWASTLQSLRRPDTRTHRQAFVFDLKPAGYSCRRSRWATPAWRRRWGCPPPR